LELRQLTYFVAVAEEGSFTRASERLFIAQPAVSRQVGHLERELGARLFARRPDGVRLTRAGEALLPRARRMLATADECRDQVAAAAGLMRGRIAVGSLFAAPRLGLSPLLAGYHGRHPDVDIAWREDTTERLMDQVGDGGADVVFVAPASEDWPGGHGAELVDRERALLLVPADHALAARASVCLADLRDEGLIALAPGSGHRTMVEHACREAGFAPLVVCEAGNTRMLLDMTAAGLGITFVPESIVPAGAALRAIVVDGPALERRVSMVWRESEPIAAPVAAFLTVAREHFASRRDPPPPVVA
jgi:DNA-binding transcriptional LysR family regulator